MPSGYMQGDTNPFMAELTLPRTGMSAIPCSRARCSGPTSRPRGREDEAGTVSPMVIRFA